MSKAVIQFVEMIREAYCKNSPPPPVHTIVQQCDNCRSLCTHTRQEHGEGWELRTCRKCGYQSQYRVKS